MVTIFLSATSMLAQRMVLNTVANSFLFLIYIVYGIPYDVRALLDFIFVSISFVFDPTSRKECAYTTPSLDPTEFNTNTRESKKLSSIARTSFRIPDGALYTLKLETNLSLLVSL